MNLSHNSQKIKVGTVIRGVHMAQSTASPTPRNSQLPTVAALIGNEPPVLVVPEQAPEDSNSAYARGVLEGREKALKELAASADAICKLAESLQAESKEMRRAVDRFATLLSLRIAAKIIGREVTEAEAVQRMIAHALSQVPVRTNLSIRLNPADAALLTPLRGKMLDKTTQLPDTVVFIPDENIHRGGCIITSALGELDARVETHLAFIEKALLAGER